MTRPLFRISEQHFARDKRPFGTSKRQWSQAWNEYGGDLLPWCDDPTILPHEKSRLAAGSKAPAFVNGKTITGFAMHTRAIPRTQAEVHQYAEHPAHGIGIITRTIRALDIDFKTPLGETSLADHQALTRVIMAELRTHLPEAARMPMRWRPSPAQMDMADMLGWTPDPALVTAPDFDSPLMSAARALPDSGSYVLLYRLADDELATAMGETPLPYKKETIYTPAGNIEFPGDGSFQILTGRHASGCPQLWQFNGTSGFDLPKLADIPLLTREQIGKFHDWLMTTYPDERSKAMRARGTLPDCDDNPEDDPVVAWMEIVGADPAWHVLPNGHFAATCPKAHLHTGAHKPDATVYIPQGWGGKPRGLSCRHESCGNPHVGEYLAAVGYAAHATLTKFTPAPAIDPLAVDTRPPLPKLVYEGGDEGPGVVLEVSQYNVNNLICHPEHSNILFSFDEFTNKARYAINGHAAEQMHDATGNEIYHYCVANRRMHKDTPKGFVDNAIGLALKRHTHSSARERLQLLRHDGVKRLDTWLSTAMGEPNTPYIKTLGIYIMTALVGRLLEPGLKADITPVFYGPPGVRKSTMVSRLALDASWSTSVSLETRDVELFNKLLGKAVVELPELQGFHTREAESIKAYTTTCIDNARLPYGKFAYDRGRQFILFGTTNDYIFLTNRLTLRRFAPLEIPHAVDTDFITDNIEQLYAEAILHFRTHGLPWMELERLAEPYARAVCLKDAWEDAIESWLHSDEAPAGSFTLSHALTHALGVRIAQQSTAATNRCANALLVAGARRGIDSRWSFSKGS